MRRRNPPPHPSGGVRPGAVAVVVALGMALAGAIAPPIGRAEPAPDLERARELYRSAEAAMQDGRYDDAARDYGAAYELSADPALFYKIGRASERAGKCDVALVYYARYLHDGKPTEQFTALTRERIAACGGDRAGGASPGPGEAGEPTAATPRPPEARPETPPKATPEAPQGGVAATAATGSAGGAAPPEGPAGPAAASGAGAAALIPPTREKIAWLVGGSAIALATLGGVLAYAAGSSENDVRDLYAGFGGQAPPFDAPTRRRYDDLVDEGRRYQHLSWAAFGLAGAAAVGVAVLFTVGRGDEPAPAVAPVIGAHAAGVSVRF